MLSCGLTYCLLLKQLILEIQCSSDVMETHCVCSIHLGLSQLLHGSWGQGNIQVLTLFCYSVSSKLICLMFIVSIQETLRRTY